MENSFPDRDPDFSCGQLKLWVQGRQFPKAMDHWDGNWLLVTACCIADGATVSVSGPIIHAGEIGVFRNELAEMNETLSGTAELPTMEPELRLDLACDRTGHVRVKCTITPDQLSQQHSFTFEIDQTHLGSIIRQCDQILEKFPIRDPQQTG